jgi:hypothetical protein
MSTIYLLGQFLVISVLVMGQPVLKLLDYFCETLQHNLVTTKRLTFNLFRPNLDLKLCIFNVLFTLTHRIPMVPRGGFVEHLSRT